MARLIALKFRVQNYRNIDDSGWVSLDRVTALVGKNESGKTSILKALHKFNPADPEPFDAQYEFPRYRYTSDFKGAPDKPWPVVSVLFELDKEIKARLEQHLKPNQEFPRTLLITRNYPKKPSSELPYTTSFTFHPELVEPEVLSKELVEVLTALENDIRLMVSPSDDSQDQVLKEKEQLITWVSGLIGEASQFQNQRLSLRDQGGRELLEKALNEVSKKVTDNSKTLIEPAIRKLTFLREQMNLKPTADLLRDEVLKLLPVFIYFENYGILRDEIFLPEFTQDLKSRPSESVTRTRHALFSHVKLDPNEILDLGRETAPQKNAQEMAAAIAVDEGKKHERSVQLSSASQDITERFSEWYKQRRHLFRYQADGNYFRIWVSDNLRRDEIELQARSKGLQWFFSFYLVFLVESEYEYKDAILLLDEPGLHLHPTAQQELISFFETLSEKNQIVYTTHSPFLIDPDNLYRVRPVAEDENGFGQVANDMWPPQRETIFPLQAALGYSLMQTLFQGKRAVLVEGLSELFYIRALSGKLQAMGKRGLDEDIFITPCQGTKMVGYMASLYLGQGVRPLVLLDSDDAGKARYKSLLDNLYQNSRDQLLLLGDVLGVDECVIEDLIGEETVIAALNEIVSEPITLDSQDLNAKTVPGRIQGWARRRQIELPKGWKGLAAERIVTKWSLMGPSILSVTMIEKAEALIDAINTRTPK